MYANHGYKYNVMELDENKPDRLVFKLVGHQKSTFLMVVIFIAIVGIPLILMSSFNSFLSFRIGINLSFDELFNILFIIIFVTGGIITLTRTTKDSQWVFDNVNDTVKITNTYIIGANKIELYDFEDFLRVGTKSFHKKPLTKNYKVNHPVVYFSLKNKDLELAVENYELFNKSDDLLKFIKGFMKSDNR